MSALTAHDMALIENRVNRFCGADKADARDFGKLFKPSRGSAILRRAAQNASQTALDTLEYMTMPGEVPYQDIESMVNGMAFELE